MTSKIEEIRKEYRQKTLAEDSANQNPFKQFDIWWSEVLTAGVEEPNAMTLATATADGIPSARIVLLKGYDGNGFVFYTNYRSAKAKHIAVNPKACLVFFWKELERQVRISGVVSKVTAAENDAYFQVRPEGSRIGAWASPQSEVISSRAWLEQEFEKYNDRFRQTTLQRPPHWGGYRVVPRVFEFWQGRPNRLHDRLQYTLQEEGNWKIERLAP